MNFRAKTVKESIVETVHIIRPSDLNDAGRLFGGVLMQWIDEVAALVAKRHSQMNVTTASVDNLQLGHFKEMLSLLLEELRMSDILLWR